MPKIRIGNYVYFDADTQGTELLPLLECLSYAVERVRPLDRFLKSYLGEPGGSAGGDPGWAIDWIDREEDALFPEDWKRCMATMPEGDEGCFEAWTHQPISDLDPPYAYYPKRVVFHHILETLKNFRAMHPTWANEVDPLMEKFRKGMGV